MARSATLSLCSADGVRLRAESVLHGAGTLIEHLPPGKWTLAVDDGKHAREFPFAVVANESTDIVVDALDGHLPGIERLRT